MVKIEIVKSLYNEIENQFNGEGHKILDLISTLETNLNKGKLIGNVGGIIIKELKYKNFRFYFLVDGYKLKLFSKNELIEVLLKFVRMSNKNNQQKVINEIKNILLTIGPKGFI
jgi:midasin (ATPase involved in ribosome maturation)